jgi:hypothetical protein
VSVSRDMVNQLSISLLDDTYVTFRKRKKEFETIYGFCTNYLTNDVIEQAIIPYLSQNETIDMSELVRSVKEFIIDVAINEF